MHDLNVTAACVLGLLLMGPVPGVDRDSGPEAMTAWQVSETAAASLSRFWNVTRSQVYLELGRLAGAGLVDELGERRPYARRPYRITEAGRATFTEWLRAWAAQEPRDDQLHSPLLLTLFFGSMLPPALLRRLVQEHHLRTVRGLERFRTMQQALAPEERDPAVHVLRWAISYHEMLVAWLDGVLQELPAESASPGVYDR